MVPLVVSPVLASYFLENESVRFSFQPAPLGQSACHVPLNLFKAQDFPYQDDSFLFEFDFHLVSFA